MEIRTDCGSMMCSLAISILSSSLSLSSQWVKTMLIWWQKTWKVC